MNKVTLTHIVLSLRARGKMSALLQHSHLVLHVGKEHSAPRGGGHRRHLLISLGGSVGPHPRDNGRRRGQTVLR